jgi:signal recognition particle subunit SRP54
VFEALSRPLSRIFSGLSRPGKLTEQNMDEGLGEIRAALLEADVHFQVAKDLIDRVREQALGTEILKSVDAGQMIVKLFHDELVALMAAPGEPLRFAKGRPTVVLLAGLQGSGKTTTAAKLALHLRDKLQRKPLLVAADVQRPAGRRPARHARAPDRRAGLPRAGPQAAAARGRRARRGAPLGCDTVIVDTAGRLHIDDELMDELVAVRKAAPPDDTFLVCDAMTGQDAVRSASAFVARLPLDGVILTKLDGDTRGGAALSVRQVTGAPVRFAGMGEKLRDLQPFHADRMAGRILGMGDVVGLVEKAQGSIDEAAAREQMEALLEDRFSLEDFLKQLQSVKKLGSLRDVVSHLPGMPEGFDPDSLDEKKLDHTQAVVLSMTPDERRRPENIDMSRKRRIARGSGTSVGAVNELLKQFEGMRRMMAQMKKGGLLSRLAGKLVPGLGGGLPDMGSLLPARGAAAAAPERIDRSERDALRRARKAERQRKKAARRRH